MYPINRVKDNILIINTREFAKKQQVDDNQYGGGKGMVMMIEPIVNALQYAREKLGKKSKVIFLTPQGKKIDQKKVFDLFEDSRSIIIILGHYEGVDERILSYVDEEISLGDYIVSNGEIASMILVDAIVRLEILPKSVTNHESFSTSFLLDYPVYTRPRLFKNKLVPEVLVKGDHAKIEEWRKKAGFLNTCAKRADLVDLSQLDKEQKKWLIEFLRYSLK